MRDKYSIHFITYGDKNYKIQKKRLSYQAKQLNCFRTINSYGFESLSEEFKNKYSKILGSDTGGGFWIWKSYILLKALEETNENDIILYLDAGSSLNPGGKKRLYEYFEKLYVSEHSFLRFDIGLKEKYWTSSEVFNYFNIEIDSEFGNSNQLAGGILFVKNTEKSKRFFKEFLEVIDYDPKLVDNNYTKNQIEGFRKPRHDQSIFSLMGKIYGSVIIPDETYFHENPKDQYHFPILTVRDGKYNLWQQVKYYILYFQNIKKVIYFGEKQYYFKRSSIYKRAKIKFVTKLNKFFNLKALVFLP